MTRFAKPHGLLALAFACMSGCSDAGTTSPEPTTLTSPLVLSDTAVAAHNQLAGADGLSAVASAVEVTYVSLPPGTIPDGIAAEITNLRTQSAVIAVFVDGGFDPVQIAARGGDTLETIVSFGAGRAPLAIRGVVPRRKAPTIVRTVPPRGRTDVPLNVRMMVVFSEPVEPSTFTTESVQLRRGAETVAGRLELDAAGLVGSFVPDGELAPQTHYELVLSTLVRDRDGEALSVSETVPFTTGASARALPASVVVTPASISCLGVGSSTQLVATVLDAVGNVLPDHAVTWSYYSIPVTNSGGLTVSASGLVTAVNAVTEGEYMVFASVGPNASGTLLRGVSVSVKPVCVTVGAGEIAYVAQVEGNTDIYLRRGDASTPVRLTSQSAIDREPAWSVDGSRIAFTSQRDGNSEIYVMDAEGAVVTRRTDNPAADYEPAWSPDGSRIAFVSERDGNAEVYAMNADGTSIVRLTNHSAADRRPSWSPDGGKIAFSSERDGTSHIYVMNADGSNVVRLTNTTDADTDPAWSPDGTRIALSRYLRSEPCVPFHQIDEGADDFQGYHVMCRQDIMIVNADGTAPTAATRLDLPALPGSIPDWWRSVFLATKATWSSDGRQLAAAVFYCLSDLGGADCHSENAIVVLSAKGTGGFAEVTRSRLDVQQPVLLSHPAWRPQPR